jgi:hypothetical protein
VCLWISESSDLFVSPDSDDFPIAHGEGLGAPG